MLKEEVKVTAGDKEEVRDIMRALLNFGMVAESTEIHGLIERLMKAYHQCKDLMSVEQQAILEKANSLQVPITDMFPEFFSKQQRVDEH